MTVRNRTHNLNRMSPSMVVHAGKLNRKTAPRKSSSSAQCLGSKRDEVTMKQKIAKQAACYDISRLMLKDQPVEEMCQHIVNLLKQGWSSSDSVLPFIEVYNRCYKFSRFTEAAKQKFCIPVMVNGTICGQVCLFYDESSPVQWEDENDFVLLKNVAEDLGLWLERQRSAEGGQDISDQTGMIEKGVHEHGSVIITDQEGRIKYANQSFCLISKFSTEELLGQNIRIINSGFHDSAFIQTFWDTLKNGRTWKGEFKNRAKDGTFYWVDATVIPILDGIGAPKQYVSIWTDVTAYKKLEQKMEMQVKELARSNDELEQFAYVVTHDLQEPLKTTSSFVNLLHRRYRGKLDGQADQYLNYLSKASERMQTLIKDLLDYSLIGSKETVADIDCNKVIEEVTARLQNCIKDTHAVIRYSPLPVINGYNDEIKDLFLHLMSNALKFKKPDVTPLIRIGAMSLEEHWQFFVQDNGIGIDEQYMERIFVIFQRLHNRSEYEGSGIGLSHCRKIVELHNGKIWLESSVGKGTTFYFTISKNLGTQAAQTGSEQQASKKMI